MIGAVTEEETGPWSIVVWLVSQFPGVVSPNNEAPIIAGAHSLNGLSGKRDVHLVAFLLHSCHRKTEFVMNLKWPSDRISRIGLVEFALAAGGLVVGIFALRRAGVIYLAPAPTWMPLLAERLNVSRQTVNAIENERYDPSLSLAFAIARLFELTIESVFDPDGTRPPATGTVDN